jgi:hypothetical protein
LKSKSAPDPALPPAAYTAWQAYLDMQASKDAHFAFLADVARRAEAGDMQSLAERAHLQGLLAAHDRAVAAFKAARMRLQETDPLAHSALVRALATASETPRTH